jgi:uncharacterized protein involved in type VI secretion and phage assembly
MSILDVLTDDEQEEARARRINGVAVGIVTNNQDPDGMGRVKLKFPWLSDNNESHWARSTTLMAGNDRGSFFLPEVGDEVLVAFEHGDINYPYVVGALWNGVDQPPEDNSDGKNNLRVIKSRSGHIIEMNDDNEGQQEKITIQTNGEHKIVLDDTAGGEKIEITDKTGNNSVTIDSVQNAITIKSAMKLTLEAQMIEIKAGATMNIEASAALKIKGLPVMIN